MRVGDSGKAPEMGLAPGTATGINKMVDFEIISAG